MIARSSSPAIGCSTDKRIFQTLHPHARLREVHLVAPQSDRFAHPQPVPVHHQHQQMIARAVPAALRGFEQLLHLGIVQEILAALVRVGGLPHPRFRPTLYITPLGRPLLALRKPASHIGSVYHTLHKKRLLWKVRSVVNSSLKRNKHDAVRSQKSRITHEYISTFVAQGSA